MQSKEQAAKALSLAKARKATETEIEKSHLLTRQLTVQYLTDDPFRTMAQVSPAQNENRLLVARIYGTKHGSLTFVNPPAVKESHVNVYQWTKPQIDAEFIFGSLLVFYYRVYTDVCKIHRGFAAHICLQRHDIKEPKADSPEGRKLKTRRAMGLPDIPAHALYLDWRGGRSPISSIEDFAIKALRRIVWNEEANCPHIIVTHSLLEAQIPLAELQPGPKETALSAPNFEQDAVKKVLGKSSGIDFMAVTRRGETAVNTQ